MTTRTTTSSAARSTSSTPSDLSRFVEYRRTGSSRLRDELIMEHRWIAERCAARLANRGEPLEDLVQVGLLALIKALDRFDPEHGSSFPRYAIPSVNGELRRHFRDHTWRLTVSRRAKDLTSAVNSTADLLHQRLGRSPKPAEIAEFLDRPVEHVLEALDARRAYRPDSTATPLSGDGTSTIDDVIGADDSELLSAAERVALMRAARKLDERRRRILLWRFYEGCTQAEIGERLGIGQVQVSRLLRSALGELATDMAPTARASTPTRTKKAPARRVVAA